MGTELTDVSGEVGLEQEFERTPVPPTHRKSFPTVAAVWFGFPLNLVPSLFGGMICALLGFQGALWAIVVGSLVLFAYVGGLSYVAGQSGRNFAMQAERTFGRLGYLVIAGSLATIVVGWFAFNSGAAGSTIHQTFGWTEWLVTLVACIIFTVIAYVGVRGLALVGFVATPLYLAAAVATLAVSLPGVSASQIWNYPGVHGSTFTFGAGVTMVVATFADSGTMTGDFTRWAKNGRQAVLAAATAFPVANLVAFLAGAVVVATGVIIDPAKSGGDFVPLMAHAHGPVMRLLAMAVVFIGLGSVCAHCLYNGALGWSNLLDRRMRTLCLVLGAIGTIAATAGVWNHILDWLNLLGVFVPPMGAVILVSPEFLGAGRRSTLRMRAIEPTAVIAYCAGALAAGVEHVTNQGFSEAVAGMVVAGVVYFVLNKVTSRRAVTPVGADQ